jgi:hypothetical protein
MRKTTPKPKPPKTGRHAPERTEAEIARLRVLLSALPWQVIKSLNISVLAKIGAEYGLKLSPHTLWKVLEESLKSIEGDKNRNRSPIVVESIGNQSILERIARVITKSYAHLGDGERVGSEDALQMIYRELKQYDPGIISRNERRALPKQRPIAPDVAQAASLR